MGTGPRRGGWVTGAVTADRSWIMAGDLLPGWPISAQIVYMLAGNACLVRFRYHPGRFGLDNCLIFGTRVSILGHFSNQVVVNCARARPVFLHIFFGVGPYLVSLYAYYLKLKTNYNAIRKKHRDACKTRVKRRS